MRIVSDTVENFELNGYCASMVLLDDACSLRVAERVNEVVRKLYEDTLNVDTKQLRMYMYGFPMGLISYDGEKVYFEIYAYDRESKTLYVYIIELSVSDVMRLANGIPP